jgi:predicted dehydrogenase
MDEIRWGIIGCGNVCEKKSAPAFNLVPGSRLVGVMRRNEERLRDFARRHQVPKCFTEAGALIDDPTINAIYIATPPHMHAPYAMQAMQASKPVYVEKPMALNHAACVRMQEVSEKAGVPLYVAYYFRSLPYFKKVKELLDAGAIGTLASASVTHIVPPPEEALAPGETPWRLQPEISGGGYFFDLACHHIDMLDFLLGPIVQASGEASNRAGLYAPEDTVVASLRFANGALAACTWCYVGEPQNSVDRIELCGTQGRITFSISTRHPIELLCGQQKQTWTFEKPQPVQRLLIADIVAALQGKLDFASNADAAVRTAWAMDRILGRR